MPEEKTLQTALLNIEQPVYDESQLPEKPAMVPTTVFLEKYFQESGVVKIAVWNGIEWATHEIGKSQFVPEPSEDEKMVDLMALQLKGMMETHVATTLIEKGTYADGSPLADNDPGGSQIVVFVSYPSGDLQPIIEDLSNKMITAFKDRYQNVPIDSK